MSNIISELIVKKDKFRKVFVQNIVTKRFVEVYENLREEGRIRTQSDCAEKIGYANTAISEILRGLRNIPVEALHKFFVVYKVDSNYIFSPSEDLDLPLIATNEFEDYKLRQKRLKENLSHLDKLVKLISEDAINQ